MLRPVELTPTPYRNGRARGACDSFGGPISAEAREEKKKGKPSQYYSSVGF